MANDGGKTLSLAQHLMTKACEIACKQRTTTQNLFPQSLRSRIFYANVNRVCACCKAALGDVTTSATWIGPVLVWSRHNC